MVYIAKGYTTVPIDPNSVLSATTVATTTTINGRSVQFTFYWNSKYKFYSMDIIDQSNQRIKRLYPLPNEMHLIRNFNPTTPSEPDAKVGLVDHGKDEKPITPETLGTRHVLTLIPGRDVGDI